MTNEKDFIVSWLAQEGFNALNEPEKATQKQKPKLKLSAQEKKAIQKLKELGWSFNVGSECFGHGDFRETVQLRKEI